MKTIISTFVLVFLILANINGQQNTTLLYKSALNSIRTYDQLNDEINCFLLQKKRKLKKEVFDSDGNAIYDIKEEFMPFMTKQFISNIELEEEVKLKLNKSQTYEINDSLILNTFNQLSSTSSLKIFFFKTCTRIFNSRNLL